jgi:glyoxylase-like metal-dependent hydrolase (beta-lactamase superfamily II)
VSLEIRLLDLGDIEADRSEVVLGRPPGATELVPVFGHLILGGEAPVLVDTGYRDPADLCPLGMAGRRRDDQALESQLAQHGLTTEDIAAVINTHLHLDHGGQNFLFPMSTPVVVNRRELEFASSGLDGPLYVARDLQHMIERLFTPGALRILDLEITGPVEIMPGISCLAAGGHTEGSQMVLVETDAGVACICGDLAYDIEDQLATPLGQVAVDEPTPVPNSPRSRRDEIAAMKRALGQGRFLLPMHDRPAVLEHGRIVSRLKDRVPPPPEAP